MSAVDEGGIKDAECATVGMLSCVPSSYVVDSSDVIGYIQKWARPRTFYI
jgi:hypothetical protein